MLLQLKKNVMSVDFHIANYKKYVKELEKEVSGRCCGWTGWSIQFYMYHAMLLLNIGSIFVYYVHLSVLLCYYPPT